VDALGGLGIAGTILQTIVGLLVFLAYATTPTVARRLGFGDRPGAIRAGIDGMWLALVLGIVLLVVGLPLAGGVVDLFGSSTGASSAATTYLSVSLWGLPGMLLVIAATGLLRGLQDTRTPLVVAIAGFALNAALNAVFIYGFGWGIAGSAAGTVIAQWAMAAVYIVMAVRAARSSGASLKPGFAGVAGALSSGGWLLIRTAALRASMIATVYAATTIGVTELATLQIALTIFSTVAFMLDALAIAGQAMIGHSLGASDVPRVSQVSARLVQIGIGCGALLGVVLIALAWLAGPVFTGDAGVQQQLPVIIVVMAIGAPLAGYVFVLDGVLIGAGDARYLAMAGIVAAIVYLPMLAAAVLLGGGLLWVWLAFIFGYMAARAVTLGLRARGDRWVVVGAR